MAREFIDKSGKNHIDDLTINDLDGFLRRIPELYWHKNENRLTSVAFGPEGMSFCLESLITPNDFHTFFPEEGLFRLEAKQLRELGDVLERDPCGPLKWEMAHVLSWGERSKIKKKKLRISAQILFPFPL